jgi:hypothetical protein
MIFELLGPKEEKYGTNKDNGRGIANIEIRHSLKRKAIDRKGRELF